MNVKTAAILTIMVISLFFNAVSFSVLMDNEAEISQLKENMNVTDQYNEAIQHIYHKDMYGYIQANEALLSVCSPGDITKAAKRTPLPAMER